MIYQLIAVLLVIIADLAINFYTIKQDHTINHLIAGLSRVIVVGSIMYNPDRTAWIVQAGILIIPYSLLFETGLNLYRGERISYIGIPLQKSLWNIVLSYRGQFSIINQVQLKLGESPIFWFKVIASIFCILLAVHDFNPYY